MMNLDDPARVHEILVVLLVMVLVPTGAVALAYFKALGAFFNELKEKEPDVWQHVGSPGIFEMIVLGSLRLNAYYAFLPVLRERAQGPGNYVHAGRAYGLLKVGLGLTTLAFALGAIIVGWIAYHGL